MPPHIRYARNSEGQNVAYTITGEGPMDLVFLPDWVTNQEVVREDPTIAHFLDRLASFSRLIFPDKRGSGLSDPVPLGAIPTPEEWADDVLAVLDDVGSRRAALFGHAEGGQMATLFAATHPSRTSALVLADTCARRTRCEDYPHGIPEDTARRMIKAVLAVWGTGMSAGGLDPRSGDPLEIQRRGRQERLAMSPGEFSAIYPMTYEIDVRAVLPTISVPTLVLHRRDNPYMLSANGRYLAEHIDGAKYVELEGSDHFFHAGDPDAMLDAVQEFLTGTKESPDHHRVLATVLFTDIVGSTERAAELGDSGWRTLLAQHHEVVRSELKRFRGREVDTAGDGFFAVFDGPARGVRCALAIRDVLRGIGLDIRAGLHTGECELMTDKVGGIAVHTGARVMSAAGPGEVLVSRTVKDLVAGSGLVFAPRGVQELKGVDGEWELFEAS